MRKIHPGVANLTYLANAPVNCSLHLGVANLIHRYRRSDTPRRLTCKRLFTPWCCKSDIPCQRTCKQRFTPFPSAENGLV